MFCSAGYGGRTTDEEVVSHCGFLDLLKKGMVIMLDRGFKKVHSMLFRDDRDGTPNGAKVVQFLTFFGVPPDGWKREAFATNP